MASQSSSSTKSNIHNSIRSLQAGILHAIKDLESHWLLFSKGVAGVGQASTSLADLTHYVNDEIHESFVKSDADVLHSTSSTVSFTELAVFVPQSLRISKEQHLDEKILNSVQNFFRYTEAEGM